MNYVDAENKLAFLSVTQCNVVNYLVRKRDHHAYASDLFQGEKAHTHVLQVINLMLGASQYILIWLIILYTVVDKSLRPPRTF